ncbi:RNA polymerase sigma factor [Pedobacter sp. SYSU D00535]|uniref:RNA polymerase sigma factor n=1 Tax=Pedobacter sp. SYSU D00535 TaxID=2810308 RepID=UPI001A963BEC|nr:sigma-70 family RNA polymerase sigma factor [Pedobacter sp. SYSU D00535]
MKVTEYELVEGCKRNERKFQEMLYKQLSAKMFAVCLRYAKSREEAEDMLQTGFVKVFNKISIFNYSGSLEGWVRRIMVNTAIEIYRKNKFMSCTIDIDENINAYSPVVHQDSLGAKELMQLISRLPGTYRIVFNMYSIEGYSHKEIAEELGISEVLSRTQLSRARTILKNKLAALEKHSERVLCEVC